MGHWQAQLITSPKDSVGRMGRGIDSPLPGLESQSPCAGRRDQCSGGTCFPLRAPAQMHVTWRPGCQGWRLLQAGLAWGDLQLPPIRSAFSAAPLQKQGVRWCWPVCICIFPALYLSPVSVLLQLQTL